MITAGAVIASVAEVFIAPWIPRIPSTRPISVLPESPRKMLAGGQIEDEESAQGAGQHDGDHRHVVVAHAHGDDAHHGRRGQADDRGQAVHAVDEIQGVDAAQQPEDRQRDSRPTQRNGQPKTTMRSIQ